MVRNVFFLSVILLVVLSACGTAVTRTETPTETPTEVPTKTPGVPLSFEPAVYRNETVGFELSYPAAWSVPDQSKLGDRADAVTFTTPENQSLSLVIYRWEPTGDLPAYIAHRRPAWENSGIVIVEEQNLFLVSGLPAYGFVLKAQDGTQFYMVFIPVADRYLEFSGTVANQLITEIAATVRPLNAP